MRSLISDGEAHRCPNVGRQIGGGLGDEFDQALFKELHFGCLQFYQELTFDARFEVVCRMADPLQPIELTATLCQMAKSSQAIELTALSPSKTCRARVTSATGRGVLDNMQLERLRALPAVLILMPFLTGSLWGQAPAAAPAAAAVAGDRALGTVTKLDAAARALTLKTDAGQEVAVTLDPKASFRRVAPGETDLRKAATIELSDVAVGDRVLARGKPAENQGVTANLIVVMSKGDIAKMQADERADWDKRGVAGLVSSVSLDSITIETRTLAGAKEIVIATQPETVVRRYASDSIKFSDATTAKLSDIRPKDQVRARGDKADDGAKLTAAEIIFGTFKTRAGVVLSIDAQTNEMRIRDLDTKSPVVVKINADSVVRKLQPQMAQTIALRLHGATSDAVAVPTGPGVINPQAGDRPGGGRGGQGGGRGGQGGGGFGARGGGDLSQMIERSPTATLADLKAGDAVVVLSTESAAQGNVTAITLLAGVEPILTKPGTQEMSLGGWSLDVGGGGGGQ
jgi:hypothetical protein